MANPPRAHFFKDFRDRNLDLGQNLSANVYYAPSYAQTGQPLSEVAPVYANETTLANNPLPQPLDVVDGYLSFWAPPGMYDIEVIDNNSPPKYKSGSVFRWDSKPGDKWVNSPAMFGDGSVFGAIPNGALSGALQLVPEFAHFRSIADKAWVPSKVDSFWNYGRRDVGLGLSTASFATAAGITINGTFETNSTGWTSNGGTGGGAAVPSRVTTPVRTGTGALQVVKAGTFSGQGVNGQITGTFLAGFTYRIGIWFTSPTAGASINFNLWNQATAPPFQSYANNSAPVATANVYQQIFLTFTPAQNIVNPVLVTTYSPISALTWYLDDITIERAASSVVAQTNIWQTDPAHNSPNNTFTGMGFAELSVESATAGANGRTQIQPSIAVYRDGVVNNSPTVGPLGIFQFTPPQTNQWFYWWRLGVFTCDSTRQYNLALTANLVQGGAEAAVVTGSVGCFLHGVNTSLS